MSIIKKYGRIDNQTGEYIIDKDKTDMVNKELEELSFLKQDILISSIKLEDFGEITLSTSQMSAIMFMIEE